jgi:hypothetical protein
MEIGPDLNVGSDGACNPRHRGDCEQHGECLFHGGYFEKEWLLSGNLSVSRERDVRQHTSSRPAIGFASALSRELPFWLEFRPELGSLADSGSPSSFEFVEKLKAGGNGIAYVNPGPLPVT